MAWYVILAILVVLASLFPAGLEGQANPLVTPAHTKPEWYYLGVYELLKMVPKLVGIISKVDRDPDPDHRRRGWSSGRSWTGAPRCSCAGGKLAVAGATRLSSSA